MSVAIVALALLGGCHSYPRDIEGTAARINRSHAIRIGLMSGSYTTGDRDRITAYIEHLSHATRANPRIATGSSELLLSKLEAGSLDLVIGWTAKDTPWRDDVAVLDPLATASAGKRDLQLGPIARNGENAWIMLLEREARDMGSKG